MTRLPIILSLLWSCGALCSAAGAAPAGVPATRPQPEPPPVEWKATWEETYSAYKAAWDKQFEALPRAEREKLWPAQRAKLLEALIEKFPQETARRLDAYRDLADYCFHVRGQTARGGQYVRKLVEESAGRPETAVGAIKIIIWNMSILDADQRSEWLEYAARRLLALHRVGHLPATDGELISALKEVFAVKLRQNLFMEAEETLQVLSTLVLRRSSLRTMEADLCWFAGHVQPALQLYQDAAAETRSYDIHQEVKRLMTNAVLSGAQLPGPRDLEMVWRSFLSSPPGEMIARADALIGRDEAGAGVLPVSASVYCSLWAALDRYVLSLKAEEIAPLRRLQADKARVLLEAARRSGDPKDLLAVYRRHPFAPAAHEAMIELGEILLRRGCPGAAQRTFQEAYWHSADAEVRKEATVGMWLALSQGNDREAMETAFAGVDADADLPWMGGRLPAKDIRLRLLAGMDAKKEISPQDAPLSRLPRRVLTANRRTHWPPQGQDDVPPEILPYVTCLDPQVQAGEGKALLSAPDLLVCFGADLSRPLWTRSPAPMDVRPAPQDRPEREYRSILGVFRPVIAGGRVYSRWGLDATRRYLTGVAAFDAEDGRMLWSTLGDPAWEDLWPIGDPAPTEGRLYLLAARAGVQPPEFSVPIYLVCLDADRGTVLWKTLLGDLQPCLQFFTGSSLEDEKLDVFHYGNAVTVREGAVYCTTNMGLVARCDARDGAIDWVRLYPQARLRGGYLEFLRRRGAAPVPAGEQVLFAPRDYYGVFALDSRTGELLWENRFVCSNEAVGLGDGLLLLSDDQYLACLDVSTGLVRWYRRFTDGLLPGAALIGSTVHVASKDALRRVDARTGAVLEEAPRQKADAARSFTIGPDAVLLAADPPADPGPCPVGEPFNPAAPKAGPLGFPVRATWRLARPDARLFLPPAGAMTDKAYLVSQAMLECIRATPAGGVEWRREAAGALRDLVWAPPREPGRPPDTMLLIHSRCVEAIDPSSGALRWRTDLPFPPSFWKPAGPRLVLADLRESPRLVAIDTASGKLLWDRDLPGWERAFLLEPFDPVGWDGKSLHLLGCRPVKNTGYYDVVLDPADGSIVGRIPLPVPKSERRDKDECTVALATDGADGFYLFPTKGIYRLTLDGPQTRLTYHADLIGPGRLEAFKLTGPWLHAVLFDRAEREYSQCVFRRDDPSYRLRLPGGGAVLGDRLYQADGRTLAEIDLPSAALLTRHVIPVSWWKQDRVNILDFWQDAGTMHVVSAADTWFGARSGPEEPGIVEHPHGGWWASRDGVRLDAFDAKSGEHRIGQVLPEIARRQEVQVARGKGVLLLCDAEGLHAYASAPADTKDRDTSPKIFYRTSALIALDGSLGEWDRSGGWTLTGQDGREGKLLLAHDAVNLYIGVAYGDTQVAPRVGRGQFGGGDWLEVRVAGNSGSYHWAVGADERGGLVWEDLGPPLPGQRQGRVAWNPADRRHTYEIAIPLKALVRQDNPDWRDLSLSVGVWEDRAGRGASCVLSLDGAGVGPGEPTGRRQALYLHCLSRPEEQAGLAILNKLPDLKESAEFLDMAMAVHGRSPGDALDFAGSFLRANPTGPLAERCLVKLDLALRRTIGDDLSQEVLKLAENGGVSQEARQRYASTAGAYLSQWVYIDPKSRPGMLILQLQDANGWEHRVSWGEFQWTWVGVPGTASRRVVPQTPQGGSWQELRVPLVWLDMHDKPIRGISFGQHGGGRVFWGRTAVVADGKEEVILDGSSRQATQRGAWEWTDQPGRGGAKSHCGVLPIGPDDAVDHAAFDFKSPVAGHVLPTAPGAASQPVDVVVAVMEQQVPKLGPTQEARRFFDALLRVESPAGDKRIARYKWFLKTFGEHPLAADVLGELLKALKDAGSPDPVAAVDAAIDELRLSYDARYAYRRRYTHTEYRFLRDWQVIGPFRASQPVHLGAVYPPETKRAAMNEQYQGVRGSVAWQLHQSETDYVDLGRLLNEPGPCVAYAACWVQSPKPRPAVLELGAEAGCKVWVNGRFLHAGMSPDRAGAGDQRVRCYLLAGWNEILVKVVQTGDRWGFYMELVDPEGRGPLGDVTVSPKPP